jgi:hypothetical protein
LPFSYRANSGQLLLRSIDGLTPAGNFHFLAGGFADGEADALFSGVESVDQVVV